MLRGREAGSSGKVPDADGSHHRLLVCRLGAPLALHLRQPTALHTTRAQALTRGRQIGARTDPVRPTCHREAIVPGPVILAVHIDLH